MLIRLSISQERGLCPENTHGSQRVNSAAKHILGATEDTLDIKPPFLKSQIQHQVSDTSFCSDTRTHGQIVQDSSNGPTRLWLRSQDPWSLVGHSQLPGADTCWYQGTYLLGNASEGCRHALDGLQRHLPKPLWDQAHHSCQDWRGSWNCHISRPAMASTGLLAAATGTVAA